LNVSLKQRLFLTLFITITIFIIINSIIYTNNIKTLISQKNNIELEHNKVILEGHFKQIQANLQKTALEVSQNIPLATSLNLVSYFEDPFDYNNELFDSEKQLLLKRLGRWLNKNKKIAIGLFDTNGKLIAMNRKYNNQAQSGYVSYDEDVNRIFKTLDGTIQSIPQIQKFDTKEVETFNGFSFKDSYFLKYSKVIYLDNKRVGYVRVGFNIDSDYLIYVNEFLDTQVIFKIDENRFIFKDKLDQKNFLTMQNNDRYKFISIDVFNHDSKLNACFIIDSNYLQSKLNTIYIEMFFQWFIGIIILFFLSYKLTFKYLIKPLETLKNVLKKMKNKEFEKIELEENGEIGKILHDVNILSKELKENISLLDNYKAVMDESLIVTVADLKGIIIYANDNFVQASGYSQEEVIGKPHSIVRHPDTSKETFRNLWKTISSKKVWKGILKNKRKDGGHYWLNIIIKPILDSDGEIKEYIAVRHDITELIEQKEQLRKLLHTDNLTELPNRRALNQDIINIQSSSLAILNVDNFRQINDFYGHTFGDKFIVELGKLINALLVHEDNTKLYRLDGDEFALLDKDNEKSLFIEKVQNIIKFVEYDNIGIDEETVSVKLTAGISFENTQHLLRTAGMALQIARKNNKDVIVYNEENSLNKEYENNILWAKK